jgi:hypothetical protein
LSEFKAKCESKEISPTDFQFKLAQRLPQYKGRWKASMADQIQNLPDFEKMINDDKIYLSDTVGSIGYDYIIDCRGTPTDDILNNGSYSFPDFETVNSVLIYPDFKKYNEIYTIEA